MINCGSNVENVKSTYRAFDRLESLFIEVIKKKKKTKKKSIILIIINMKTSGKGYCR
jgi:hypothetical protein